MGDYADLFFLSLLFLFGPFCQASQLVKINSVGCEGAPANIGDVDMGRVTVVSPSLFAVEVGVDSPKHLYVFAISTREKTIKVYGIFNSPEKASEALEQIKQAGRLSYDEKCLNRFLVDGLPIDGIDDSVHEEHQWKTVRNCDVDYKTLIPLCNGV